MRRNRWEDSRNRKAWTPSQFKPRPAVDRIDATFEVGHPRRSYRVSGTRAELRIARYRSYGDGSLLTVACGTWDAVLGFVPRGDMREVQVDLLMQANEAVDRFLRKMSHPGR